MADYAKLKVPELREALQKRNLPTSGVKADLVARLQAADKADPPVAATPTTPATAITAAALATATSESKPTEQKQVHLPSAEDEFEVDWDHEDDAPKPAATAPSQPASESKPVAPVAVGKPKRKTIASLFDEPLTAIPTTATATPAAAAGAKANEASSPSTVTDEATKPSSPEKPAESFAANLPTTSLDEEIARRKKRAERFGLSVEESEALKALERQKRFGAGAVKEVAKEGAKVKGLDEALPEGKRRKDEQGGRGGRKRGRFETRRGKAELWDSNGLVPKVVERNVGKKVTDDPEERRKAEERKKRFSS